MDIITTDQINEIIEQIRGDIRTIQQPRSEYVLRHFVVGEKDTDIEAWAQCLLEMERKYFAIRRAEVQLKKHRIERQRLLDSGDEIDQLDAELKALSVEETELGLIGAKREFATLWKIYQEFNAHYTRADIEAGQAEYWHRRLTRQASQDINAGGRIGVGNQDALRQAGIKPQVENGTVRFFLDANAT